VKREELLAARVIFLFGPSGSGKTTFALRNMFRGDLLLDIDMLCQSISGTVFGARPGRILDYAKLAKEAILTEAMKLGETRVWITSCIGDRREQDKLIKKYNAKRLVFDVPAAECIRRLDADPKRRICKRDYVDFVHRWWNDWTATA